MANASGFTFGCASSGLFGATTKTSASTFPAFGTTTTVAQPAGLSFGLTKSTPSGTPSTGAGLTLGLGFGSTTTSTSAAAGSTGFAFGKPSATVSAFSVAKTTQQLGFGALSTTTTTSSGLGLGQGIFGTKPAGTATSTFQLTAAPAQNAAFGFGSSANVKSSAATTNPSSNVKASTENPKDSDVPAPLMEVFKELSKHINEQREKKDEIARFSAQLINKATEEITALKQLVSEVSNGMQRDAAGVDNLKSEVLQEQKFAEVARRVHDVAPSLQHDNKAPMEYFQYLAGSFEARLISYRQQLDELEMYLSSSSALNEFSPQDLFSVLRKLNDTFLALAAQLHIIHESAMAIKEKYSQYRRVVLHDSNDVFGYRNTVGPKTGARGIGPCPFSGLAGPSGTTVTGNLHAHGAGSQTSTKIGTFGSGNAIAQPSLAKTLPGSGLTRSLSFSGLSTRSSAASSLGSSFTTSLFGKPGSTAATPQFQLQNPPGTKRGKVN